MPDEYRIWTGRESMFRNRPFSFTIGIALTSVSIYLLFVVKSWAWYLCLAFLAISLLGFLRWWLRSLSHRLIVTNLRSIMRLHLLAKTTNEVRHADVRNIQVHQSLFQRIMRTGELRIESASGLDVPVQISGIPYPDRLATLIRSLRDTGEVPAGFPMRAPEQSWLLLTGLGIVVVTAAICWLAPWLALLAGLALVGSGVSFFTVPPVQSYVDGLLRSRHPGRNALRVGFGLAAGYGLLIFVLSIVCIRIARDRATHEARVREANEKVVEIVGEARTLILRGKDSDAQRKLKEAMEVPLATETTDAQKLLAEVQATQVEKKVREANQKSKPKLEAARKALDAARFEEAERLTREVLDMQWADKGDARILLGEITLRQAGKRIEESEAMKAAKGLFSEPEGSAPEPAKQPKAP